MPPDSSAGKRSPKSASPTICNAAPMRASAGPFAGAFSSNGNRTLLRTLRHGSSVASWNTSDNRMPWRRATAGGCPAMPTVPAVGSTSPAISRSSVLLPQPEGPTIETNCPCGTSSSRSRRARIPPR